MDRAIRDSTDLGDMLHVALYQGTQGERVQLTGSSSDLVLGVWEALLSLRRNTYEFTSTSTEGARVVEFPDTGGAVYWSMGLPGHATDSVIFFGAGSTEGRSVDLLHRLDSHPEQNTVRAWM